MFHHLAPLNGLNIQDDSQLTWYVVSFISINAILICLVPRCTVPTRLRQRFVRESRVTPTVHPDG